MGLSLKLLGEFEVRDEAGEPLALPTRKTRALLAYLAVNADKPQQRERLMTLLWSDRGEQQARHSLNQALMSIRRLGNTAGVTFLDGDGERVRLLGDAIAIDVAEFRDRLANDPGGAAGLYHGPFLDGLTIPDPAFEEWLTATRSELHGSACDALARAADQATKDGDAAGGIDILRRLVALDPLHEEAHRRLMKLLHDNGDRAGALRQYQSCVENLKKNLQVEPDAATKALYEEIRTDSSSSTEATAPLSEPDASQPSVPDKPSIAVLPFTNLSGDPEQDFFGDGLAEDIITELSRFRSLFVIARNSSFIYKGRAVDVKTVAQDLGVRYVLEGSVRKSAQRIRVAVQLIDAETGSHIWAERYDRDLDDLFAIQDEITQTIIGAIEPALVSAEKKRARQKSPDHLNAWDLYQRGLWHFLDDVGRDALTKAKQMFEQACKLDASFAAAHAGLAHSHVAEIIRGVADDPEASLDKAAEAAERAVALDPREPMGRIALGRVLIFRHAYERAIAEMEAGIELNPSSSRGYYGLGQALMFAGRPKESIPQFERAIQLSPRSHRLWACWMMLGLAYVNLAQYEEAAISFEKAIEQPTAAFLAYAFAAAALSHLGRIDEAHAMIAEAKTRRPGFSLETVRRTARLLGPHSGADRITDGLRMAGLLE